MEFWQGNKELSCFVDDEIKGVVGDLTFSKTSSNVIDKIKQMLTADYEPLIECTSEEMLSSEQASKIGEICLEADDSHSNEDFSEGLSKEVLSAHSKFSSNSESEPSEEFVPEKDDNSNSKLHNNSSGKEETKLNTGSIKSLETFPEHSEDEESPCVKLQSLTEVEKPNIVIINDSKKRRKDVIIKSILRAMRRDLWAQMETLTDFKKRDKNIEHKHQTFMRSLDEIVAKLGWQNFAINMSFYYGVLAYPVDMKKILEKARSAFKSRKSEIDNMIGIIKLVERTYNRFSTPVFNDFINIPEVAFLVSQYLAKSKVEANPVNFAKWFEYLKEESNKSMEHFSKEQKPMFDSTYCLNEKFNLY